MDGKTLAQEARAALILSRLPEFGPGRYWQLRRQFPSNQAILNAPFARFSQILAEQTSEALRDYQRNPADHPLSRQAERDEEWLAENDVALLTPEHPSYPSLLTTISQAPPLLFVRGDVDNLSLPQLAVVGSRNPSPTGKDNAFDFARQLARTGFGITSGLALGVDGAAHRGALAAGGKTVAVMGTGIDRLYPHRHRGLADQIVAEGGTLVSEFPLGTTPQALNFPRRNRIISAMSLGVLVVEAAIKSGSLITAKYAMQQGREVFAIPGSIHNPLSRGCHALLREGATLVEQIDDLREPLQGLLALKWSEAEKAEADSGKAAAEHPVYKTLDPDERRLLEGIGYEDTSLDAIMARTGLDAGQALALLIGLEIKGLVRQTPGGYQRSAGTVTS